MIDSYEEKIKRSDFETEDETCIEEEVAKLRGAVKELKKKQKEQKKVLKSLKEEDFNMLHGCGFEAVPTVPVASGGCCGNNNGWGNNGILEGLLIGGLMRGGFGGWGGYGGFGGMGGMGTANLLDTSLTGAIDTGAILGAVNGVGRDILKTAGTHEIAAANHAASINANISNSAGRLAQEVGALGYNTTVNTLEMGADLSRQMCAEGRHQDTVAMGLGREVAGVDRHVGESSCRTQREVLEGNWALSRQMDQIAREQAACCCDNKLLMTMGFANVENSIKDGFCGLKADMAREKIEELRIAQATTREAINSQALAQSINTTLTNGFTQLGATFNSNVLAALTAANA